MPNSLTISAKAGAPYIEVKGHGLWHPQHAEQHFRDLDRDLKLMRSRTGLARVLVDLGNAKVQTSETADIMHRWTARIYRPDDQVAIVCASQLLAMQIKHRAKIDQMMTSRDRDEAIAWLLAQAKAEPLRRAAVGA